MQSYFKDLHERKGEPLPDWLNLPGTPKPRHTSSPSSGQSGAASTNANMDMSWSTAADDADLTPSSVLAEDSDTSFLGFSKDDQWQEKKTRKVLRLRDRQK